MKNNTKSSITLPPEELALVVQLMKQLHAKSKVEVIRRGLKLLKESTEREELRLAYATAARKLKNATPLELEELDNLPDGGDEE
jgi:Arc/MetJ-type ribon-helix-helix transcriptional regulator